MAMVFFVAILLAWIEAAEVFRFANAGLNKKGCLLAPEVMVLLEVAGSIVSLPVPLITLVARSSDWTGGAD